MRRDAKGLGAGLGTRVIQWVSAGPFARPPVTRSEAVVLPGTCASEGGWNGSALVFSFCCLFLLGCSGGLQKIVRPPAEPLSLTTAFVYPFDFRWEEPVYRKFELSQRLVDEAVHHSGDRFAFFGPSEFRVMRQNDNGAWVASTALPLLINSGSRADQGIVIRPWAENRKNSSAQEAFDKKGKSTGMATMEETTYFGHVDVIHPSTGQVLVEVSGEVKVDPFSGDAADDSSDPARPLTKLMAALLAEALDAIAGQAAVRNVRPELGLTLALTPRVTLGYAEDGRPNTQLVLAAQDAVAQEIFVQDRAKFLAPMLPEGELPKLSKLPAGTYVIAAPSTAKLQPGDLVLSIDGVTALPQGLSRLRFSAVPAQVRVRRATGEETEVLLP